MKTTICLFSLYLALSLPAGAGLYSSGPISTAIPDNSTVGTAGTLSYSFTGAGSQINDVALTFTLQGGYAGDLSGYLRLGNETTSPSYDLTTLIQGQTLSASTPTSYSISFTTTDFKNTFSGLNPNNTWTLFFADTQPGDQTMVNGWSLDISAVPEPTNVALGIFGALAGLCVFVRAKVLKV